MGLKTIGALFHALSTGRPWGPHGSLAVASPELRRSTSVPGIEVLRGEDGVVMEERRRCHGGIRVRPRSAGPFHRTQRSIANPNVSAIIIGGCRGWLRRLPISPRGGTRPTNSRGGASGLIRAWGQAAHKSGVGRVPPCGASRIADWRDQALDEPGAPDSEYVSYPWRTASEQLSSTYPTPIRHLSDIYPTRSVRPGRGEALHRRQR